MQDTRDFFPFSKKWFFLFILVMFAAGCSAAGDDIPDLRLYDLAGGKEVTLSETLPDLSKKRIVLVGEFHSRMVHHENQLRIIRAVFESGVPVAIGFEMFRSDSQPALDRWVSGEMDIGEFRKVYDDNWNFPWDLYSPIFEYARKNQVPMIGLNVSRDITRQVARMGFKSLSGEQKGKLQDVSCRVDKEYMDFIRKAFGAHAHGGLNFTNFCEAQLVWDNVMAISALEFLKERPGWTMVMITGSGHARKKGVPEQIRKRSNLSLTVLLPEVPGAIDLKTTTEVDADFIMMHR
ncbi:MAG: ChaN family lipoprotein [Pseudomonadota bacterium]